MHLRRRAECATLLTMFEKLISLSSACFLTCLSAQALANSHAFHPKRSQAAMASTHACAQLSEDHEAASALLSIHLATLPKTEYDQAAPKDMFAEQPMPQALFGVLTKMQASEQ